MLRQAWWILAGARGARLTERGLRRPRSRAVLNQYTRLLPSAERGTKGRAANKRQAARGRSSSVAALSLFCHFVLSHSLCLLLKTELSMALSLCLFDDRRNTPQIAQVSPLRCPFPARAVVGGSCSATTLRTQSTWPPLPSSDNFAAANNFRPGNGQAC